ncbi:myocardin-like [Protopterus annectens]|uniref:myocardin-like n=1 Tax=Protopterus annectens TaxID=7888 RepID=UPI001CFB5749|nr:myocardin-like [Protopterus annectens]
MTLLASERSMLIRSKFRSVLQLRMQNRRTQEQRAENAIMPALEKAQPTFSEPPNGLDRCRIEELGKHKDHNRPMQTDVGKAHLPEESNVEVTELKQKKARLTEDLSDRILHQPGPLELLEKNILPLDSSIKDAMKGQIPFPETSESFPFDDDLSSTASSSPEQPGHEQSRCFATSPGITNDESSSTSSTNFQCHFQLPQGMEINQSIVASVSEAESLTINGQATNGISTTKAPILPKAPLKPSEAAKSQRHKKPKDSRPKVKKLKYHQYVPPDQKAEKVPATMDTAYSQLLQQQQIFLQQQIINQQQKQAFCLQAVFPINTSDHIISFTSAAPTCAPAIPLSSPTTPSTPSTPSPSKPELLPANLDDLTVSELRQQLRKRGLPVSGTKPALLERLKSDQVARTKQPPVPITSNNLISSVLEMPSMSNYVQNSQSTGSSVTSTFRTISPPSLSPTASEPSIRAPDPTGGFPDGMEVSPIQVLSGITNNGSVQGLTNGLESKASQNSSKSSILLEKQKVIDNLTWKLQQEQKQAEDLKVELEMQKRLKNRRKMHLSRNSSENFIAIPPCMTVGTELSPEAYLSPESSSVGSHFLFNLNNHSSLCSQDSQEPPRDATCGELMDLANSSATETGLPTFLGSDSGAIRQDSNLEVFCPSVGEDFDLPMQITASPTNNTSGSSRSLEEELRDAIKRVQMAPSQSIDDILEDHIVCTDGTAQSDIIFLEPQTEDHLVSSTDFTSSFPNSTHLSSFSQELASLKPRNGDSQPMVLEFPGTSQYDLLGGSFSPACIEMPPSPENQDKRVDQKKTTFDPADWLEALTSGSASGFGPGSPVSQSIFSTDFFDSPDLNINRMIELIIEQCSNFHESPEKWFEAVEEARVFDDNEPGCCPA